VCDESNYRDEVAASDLGVRDVAGAMREPSSGRPASATQDVVAREVLARILIMFSSNAHRHLRAKLDAFSEFVEPAYEQIENPTRQALELARATGRSRAGALIVQLDRELGALSVHPATADDVRQHRSFDLVRLPALEARGGT